MTDLVNALRAKQCREGLPVEPASEADEKHESVDGAGNAPLEYAVSCEHHHSNLVLLAQTKFRDRVSGKWNTWIDYDRFHDLVAANKPFTAMDYVAPTPDWASFGADERGMDPQVSVWRCCCFGCGFRHARRRFGGGGGSGGCTRVVVVVLMLVVVVHVWCCFVLRWR
jgi:hypothetical protein